MNLTKEELIERFTLIDYGIFVVLLCLSAGIGLFYGCFKKAADSQEFLMAGRSMGTFPVAMSLIASFMSAITLLGNPSEVYQRGLDYWLIALSYVVVMTSAALFFLPVFWNLQVTSAYEYLEKRFNVTMRRLGSMLFIFQMSIYMAIVVYAPALALSQVTGFNVYLSVSAICFVCIFYTSLGGMKAVLWTDTLQVIIMYGCMVFIIAKGTYDEGGVSAVWDAGVRGNRTKLVNWDPRPTSRHTFWTLVIGGYFTWITIYGTNQAQIQRYMCVRKFKYATRALFVNLAGLVILVGVCSYAGLVIYKRYEACDPIKTGIISTDDQLLPLYVMDAFGLTPGLPGVFVAGIFSGALSTVSSGMNSLAAICLEDFVKGIWFPNLSEKKATIISKLLSVFFGVLTFALVFVAEKLGSILSAALSLYGVLGGPVMGAFTLGMFFPWANAKGAIAGTLSAFALTLWINIGYNMAIISNNHAEAKIPTNTYGCYNQSVVEVISNATVSADGDILEIYKLSYLYYAALACLTVVVVGMIVSAITGFEEIKSINPKLISPAFHWLKPYIPGGSSLGVDYEEADDENLGRSRVSLGLENPAFIYLHSKVDTQNNEKLDKKDG